jgi:hypothetical protein
MKISDFTVPLMDPYQNNSALRIVGPMARSGTVVYDTDYGEYARYIIVATSGSVTVMHWDGETTTFPLLIAGIMYPIESKQIVSSGTTVPANQIIWGS